LTYINRNSFNLAIACINQGHHTEAAEHLLRALEKQHDSDEDVGEPLLQHINASENVESSNLLWETLATCCNNLKRADLAQVCSSKNLAPFREVFSF
jgi:peroxin-5